jgi:hypothetical protein
MLSDPLHYGNARHGLQFAQAFNIRTVPSPTEQVVTSRNNGSESGGAVPTARGPAPIAAYPKPGPSCREKFENEILIRRGNGSAKARCSQSTIPMSANDPKRT